VIRSGNCRSIGSRKVVKDLKGVWGINEVGRVGKDISSWELEVGVWRCGPWLGVSVSLPLSLLQRLTATKHVFNISQTIRNAV
jgi:hypothetical protein